MNGPDDQRLLALLRQARVVPVIRLADRATAERAALWCLEEGFPAVEVTLSCPGALEIIAELAGREDVCVGAGTVLSLDDARRAIEAGAAFVVSPAAVPGLVEAVRAAGRVPIPGAFTPSEVLARASEGAAAVKVFPARQAGGPGYLKALRQTLPNVPLMPTGGIGLDDAAAYLEAGALAVGLGGELIQAALFESGDRQGFAQRVALMRAALGETR